MEKQIVKFLDYEIRNSGNQDRWVLLKPDCSPMSYETHLGNYDTAHDAMKAAITHFMIARPNDFSAQIYHRTIGTKTCHEWFKFCDVCEREDIKIPIEIQKSHGQNCTIEFVPELSDMPIGS